MVVVVAERVGMASVVVWLSSAMWYFATVNVVAFVVVAVVAEFVASVDFFAVVSVIVEPPFSALDRLPCMKTRTEPSSIFDPPSE